MMPGYGKMVLIHCCSENVTIPVNIDFESNKPVTFCITGMFVLQKY